MDRQPTDTERISIADASTRLGGVILLVVVGYSHLLDLSHKIDEGIWYMAIAFIALIGASMLVAILLVRAPASSVRLAWVAAVALCVSALWGYVVSRMVRLPGMADHAGDWINTYGAMAVLAELAVISVAAFAMRDLTNRGVRHEAPRSIRIPTIGGWPTATIVCAALAATPSASAWGHGGEDDEAAAESAPSQSAGSSQSTGRGGEGETATAAPVSGGHGDPFLGSFELTVAMVVSAAFIAWAARDLFSRARLAAVPG